MSPEFNNLSRSNITMKNKTAVARVRSPAMSLRVGSARRRPPTWRACPGASRRCSSPRSRCERYPTRERESWCENSRTLALAEMFGGDPPAFGMETKRSNGRQCGRLTNALRGRVSAPTRSPRVRRSAKPGLKPGLPCQWAKSRFDIAIARSESLTVRKSNRIGTVGIPGRVKLKRHRGRRREPPDAGCVRTPFKPVGVDLGLSARRGAVEPGLRFSSDTEGVLQITANIGPALTRA